MNETMNFKTLMIAAMAMLAAACTKNDFYSDSDESTKTRTITATFATSDTKTTTTDGKTPLWAASDKIWISDGTNTKTIELIENGQTPTGDQAVMSSDKKSFTFTLPSQWGENLYSVYPASCATGTAGSSGIGITIPSTQDGTFGSANICVAQGTSTLSYKNAAAIIKITGNGTANDYMFFTASNTSAPAIAGTFTASISDNTVSLTAGTTTSSEIKGTLQKNDANSVSYFAIATCTATSLTLKARKTGTSNFATQGYPKAGGTTTYTFAVNKIYTLTMPTFSDEQYNERIIIGEFSVSSTKKVYFSPGNLWSDGESTPTLKFETNQYDYRDWSSTHVCHFYWTNRVSEADDEEYTTYSGDDFFCSENNKLSVDGTPGWYTLSYAEWEYLLGRSSSSLYKYGVTVCGKYSCLILAPDGFTGTIEASYDASTWSAAEAQGLVCLPAAGARDGSSVYAGDYNGFYCSSTPNGTIYACYLIFDYDTANVYGNIRNHGQSVRLVRE